MSMRRDSTPTLATRSGIRPRSPAEALEPQRASPRPRGAKQRRSDSKRVSGFVRVVSGLLTVVLVSFAAVGGSALFLRSTFDRPGPLETAKTVVIPRGEGRIEIADRLEREGVISNRWGFVANHLLIAYGEGKPVELKAGEYEFKQNATMRDVLETIVGGKSILYKVTVPEGLTSQQIVERLNAEENLSGEIRQIPTEGSLLPDTYRISKGMARQDLIDRMQADHARVLQEAWDKRSEGLPIQTPQQVVVLASIIEKETGRADERDRVAGVFVNRLKKNMRLQSDPTIIYGIVGGQGSLGRPITRTDIDTKTPYNTYTINGLPPGPICNPGKAAIEAALNPAKTTDLYFVADGTGGHTFSDTLKEHNAAVSTWRKVEKEKIVDATKEAGEAVVQTGAAATIPSPPTEADAGPAQSAETVSIPLPVRKPKK